MQNANGIIDTEQLYCQHSDTDLASFFVNSDLSNYFQDPIEDTMFSNSPETPAVMNLGERSPESLMTG
jgi:hypothetical protein